MLALASIALPLAAAFKPPMAAPALQPTVQSLPRHAAPQMFFWDKPAPPPAPPAPPPSTPATQVVRRDLLAYGGLIALGAVPALDWVGLGGMEAANNARLIYFSTLAVGSVYLGVQRQDLGETSPISGKSAALAPVFASVTLGSLYFLIKYTGLDPGSLYRFFACLFALLATSDLLQPILGLAVSGELLAPADDAFGDEREAEVMNAGVLPAFGISLLLVAAYLQGPTSFGGALPLPLYATLNNYLGWGITMASLGVLALESYVAGAALLGGLFFYDAFFVFQSDAMLTVATKIEAPAKFLFAAVRGAGDTRYPFSVLGLGDVVVPGAFVSLLREVDRDGLPQADEDSSASDGAAAGGFGGFSFMNNGAAAPAVTSDSDGQPDGWAASPYFAAGLGGYTAGLGITFVANAVSGAGQPALVYIVPSLLLASAGTALARGELPALLGYRSARAAAATEARRAWKEARDAEREAEAAAK